MSRSASESSAALGHAVANGGAATSARAPVLEVFASIQGEGAFVGEPQVFVRLSGCPMRCAWCDTPGSWALPARDAVSGARVGLPGASRREAPWASPFQVATWIGEAEEGYERTISVTGGEPLLWPDFVLELEGFVGKRRIHLETAGAHPRALERVLSVVSHVSLDLKLPADMHEPVPVDSPVVALEGVPRTDDEWRSARRASLALVAKRDACAKLIVAGERDARDFAPLLEDVKELAPDLPVFVQPVSPMHGVSAPDQGLLLAVVEEALERELTVRVVPQVHRTLRLP